MSGCAVYLAAEVLRLSPVAKTVLIRSARDIDIIAAASAFGRLLTK